MHMHSGSSALEAGNGFGLILCYPPDMGGNLIQNRRRTNGERTRWQREREFRGNVVSMRQTEKKTINNKDGGPISDDGGQGDHECLPAKLIICTACYYCS